MADAPRARHLARARRLRHRPLVTCPPAGVPDRHRSRSPASSSAACPPVRRHVFFDAIVRLAPLARSRGRRRGRRIGASRPRIVRNSAAASDRATTSAHPLGLLGVSSYLGSRLLPAGASAAAPDRLTPWRHRPASPGPVSGLRPRLEAVQRARRPRRPPRTRPAPPPASRRCEPRLGNRCSRTSPTYSLDGRLDHVRELGVLLHEPRRMAVVEAEQVVPHEHLAVDAGAGADPDRRDREQLGDPGGDRRRHRLEHEREAAGRLERERVAHELDRLRRRSCPAP